jgi:hypothetical protein
MLSSAQATKRLTPGMRAAGAADWLNRALLLLLSGRVFVIMVAVHQSPGSAVESMEPMPAGQA